MIRPVYGKDEFVAAWVAGQLGAEPYDRYRAIGIADGKRLIGGIVYDNYNGHKMEITLATTSPRWGTRRILYTMFSYPFLQIGVGRLVAETAVSNDAINRVIERMGFTFEGIARAGRRTEDARIYSMLPHECKWIRDDERNLRRRKNT
jgi:RimJ/RimL family protein N-acetyltransferase